MPTHGQHLTGSGSQTAKTFTAIATNITLPAGGPWTIFGIWMYAIIATALTAEAMDGAMKIVSLSGDLTPDPAPGIYPVAAHSCPIGAHFGPASTVLNIWPVNWEAAGKSIIEIHYAPNNALSSAPVIMCGIIYGDSIPEARPLVFCNYVQADWAAATETALGTITLAEKATRVVGLCGTLGHTAAPAVDVPVVARFRLSSEDVKLAPASFPFNQALSPSDGTLVGSVGIGQTNFIPVDIPVAGGARIDCFATSAVNVTNSCSAAVFIAYE